MKEIYNNYIFVKKNKTCHMCMKIVELFLFIIVCKNCIHFQKSSRFRIKLLQFAQKNVLNSKTIMIK